MDNGDEIQMRVELGKKLIYQLQQLVLNKTLEEEQIDKVYIFIEHVESNGLAGLEGRNKNSANIPIGAKDYDSRVSKAIEKKWWHYHIGINFYEQHKIFGDKTSLYIIHYSNFSPYYIRLAKLDYHPPFNIPNNDWLRIR
ncbi:TPA: hypothetical protein ACTW95_000494 [Klebsiella quasipneumoniae subsp. similipneumoniae]